MGFELQCPLPLADHPRVLLAHGGGGRLMQRLIAGMFQAALGAPPPGEQHDGALLAPAAGRLAFTTDSYVVRPRRFPGGDIGSLAVHGTVNDLAMCGARPRWLSAGFILEEGLPMAELWGHVCAMAAAARDSGVAVVTGDTKVVERGKGDGLYVNTAGIGEVVAADPPMPGRVRPGDAILLSGDLGRHGMAILQAREGLAFESAIESDSASVAGPVLALYEEEMEVHCLRDCTRGGLGAALHEIAAAAGVEIRLEEEAVPVRDDVRGACEILGLDPLFVACEGRFVAFVPAGEAETALALLERFGVAAGVRQVGEVTGEREGGRVLLRTALGVDRMLDLPAGEQLPRIC